LQSRFALRGPRASDTLPPDSGAMEGPRHTLRNGCQFASLREIFMEAYERLRQLVESAADDVNKAEGGNKAAGTRVRKVMQEVKAAAQDVRKDILESRSDSDGA
jgi:hypothetical protein